MSLRKFIPRVCAASSLLCVLASTAFAQTDTRPRQTATVAVEASGQTRLENEPTVVSTAEDFEGEDFKIVTAPPTGLKLAGLHNALLTAIDARMGTPYRLGATGPTRYDCSGFVWSVFQAAGVTFERSSARTLWQRFEPATEDDKYKFGTLVFFNHLGHVGIVADANGFYHASTSRGVVYSTFNEYWSKRLVGFRRVPLAGGAMTIAKVSHE